MPDGTSSPAGELSVEVSGIDQANEIAAAVAILESAKRGVPVYASRVYIDEDNFAFNPRPEFWLEGVAFRECGPVRLQFGLPGVEGAAPLGLGRLKLQGLNWEMRIDSEDEQ